MKIEIRSPKSTAEWESYYDLRYRILREPFGKPKGSERNEGDETGQHFALFENGLIQAVARLDQLEAGIFQVRFVAVDTEIQGKGYGKKIMEAVEFTCKEHKAQKIVLHARDYALPFYEKLNYVLIGKSYKLFDVLQHYEMEKIV